MTGAIPGTLSSADEALRAAVVSRKREGLARAITLIESTRMEHRRRADGLLNALLPHIESSLRIGISGPPGVGKSTLIEAFGLHLVRAGHRVAVLAVDPSSPRSGGSILGDKTRMERLSMHPDAFIRPSPAAGSLGGVTARTRESMLVCEAAGFDVVIVETVGVGQSETAVAAMTDVFVLLQLPNAGDELQAMKKGIVELADVIVVNKCDLDRPAAERAARHFGRIRGVSGEVPPSWTPRVLLASAVLGEGIGTLWTTLRDFRDVMRASGELAAKRQHQTLAWMWQQVDDGLRSRFRSHPLVQARLDDVVASVSTGGITATAAANCLLDLASR